jgi:hypothetical protein
MNKILYPSNCDNFSQGIPGVSYKGNPKCTCFTFMNSRVVLGKDEVVKLLICLFLSIL